MRFPRTVLVVAERFPQLGATRVASAIADGILEAAPEYDLSPLPLVGDGEGLRLGGYLELALLRTVRAVVLADGELLGRAAPSGVMFEVATAARQAGVPAYAITGVREPDLFQARMLDIQVALPALGERSLTGAGRKLGGLI